jgi:hypothetical protein
VRLAAHASLDACKLWMHEWRKLLGSLEPQFEGCGLVAEQIGKEGEWVSTAGLFGLDG